MLLLGSAYNTSKASFQYAILGIMFEKYNLLRLLHMT